LRVSRATSLSLVVAVAVVSRYPYPFFPLRFSSNLNQNQTRITIERDGKSSELQVDEGENILQVRRRVLVYLV